MSQHRWEGFACGVLFLSLIVATVVIALMPRKSEACTMYMPALRGGYYQLPCDNKYHL